MVPNPSLALGLTLVAIALTSTLPNVYGGSYWYSMGQIQCNWVSYGFRGKANITLTNNGQAIASRVLYCSGYDGQVSSWPITTFVKPDGWKMTVSIYDPTNPAPPVCSATGSGTRFPGTVTLRNCLQDSVANATGTLQKPVRN